MGSPSPLQCDHTKPKHASLQMVQEVESSGFSAMLHAAMTGIVVLDDAADYMIVLSLPATARRCQSAAIHIG